MPTDSGARWSHELIECVVSFISHSHSFFSLLEALSGLGDDDALDHLRRIGQARWPVLRLIDDQQTWLYGSVLQYYSCVQVELHKDSDWSVLAEVTASVQRLEVIMDWSARPTNFESPTWKHWMTYLPIAAIRSKYANRRCKLYRFLVKTSCRIWPISSIVEVDVDYDADIVFKSDEFGGHIVYDFFFWLAQSSNCPSMSKNWKNWLALVASGCSM
ncbi:Aste57867_13334 [Aphanomyces stellatus]|uniref:Aste57867_13334 protein n=1 Tax=Aphanomyces stellatus TaxID=120398 RepID=A0A485KYC9_9STRA|nr:hypothetical protein As57867_013285 [Aphanomyces stellatus]VFT90173.1 Aste57867_13334 [Aphanomyces stellatus]